MLGLVWAMVFAADGVPERQPLVYNGSSVVILGTLPEPALEAMVQVKHSAFEDCVSKDTPTGRVSIQFWVDSGGALSGTTLRQSTLEHPQTEACLLGVVRGITFPPLPGDASARVTLPFKINSLPPTLTLESATVTKGETDETRVRTLLEDKREALLRCMDGTLNSGTLRAELRLDALGHLEKVKDQGEVLASFCLKRTLSEVYFPLTPNGKPVRIEVVYRFSSGLD